MAARVNPVRSAPTLIHAVALVGHDVASTELNIRKLMKGFPPQLYKLANQLVIAVLKGRPLAWARSQARKHANVDQRRQARLVLLRLTPLLRSLKPDWVRVLDVDPYQVGPKLQLPVKVQALMKVDGKVEVLVLHLWQKPLGERPRRAAATILKDRLSQREELTDAGLRWFDISIPDGEDERGLREFSWSDIRLMDDEELQGFIGTLREGWELYQLNPVPPRPPRPRPSPDQADFFPDGPG